MTYGHLSLRLLFQQLPRSGRIDYPQVNIADPEFPYCAYPNYHSQSHQTSIPGSMPGNLDAQRVDTISWRIPITTRTITIPLMLSDTGHREVGLAKIESNGSQ